MSGPTLSPVSLLCFMCEPSQRGNCIVHMRRSQCHCQQEKQTPRRVKNRGSLNNYTSTAPPTCTCERGLSCAHSPCQIPSSGSRRPSYQPRSRSCSQYPRPTQAAAAAATVVAQRCVGRAAAGACWLLLQRRIAVAIATLIVSSTKGSVGGHTLASSFLMLSLMAPAQRTTARRAPPRGLALMPFAPVQGSNTRQQKQIHQTSARGPKSASACVALAVVGCYLVGADQCGSGAYCEHVAWLV